MNKEIKVLLVGTVLALTQEACGKFIDVTPTPYKPRVATLTPSPTLNNAQAQSTIESGIATGVAGTMAAKQSPTVENSPTATETSTPTMTPIVEVTVDKNKEREKLLGENRVGAWDAGLSMSQEARTNADTVGIWYQLIDKDLANGTLTDQDIRTYGQIKKVIGNIPAYNYRNFQASMDAAAATGGTEKWAWMVADKNKELPKAYQLKDVLMSQAHDLLVATRDIEPSKAEISGFYDQIEASLFKIQGKGTDTQVITKDTYTGPVDASTSNNDKDRQNQPDLPICTIYTSKVKKFGQEYIDVVNGQKTLFASNLAKMEVYVTVDKSGTKLEEPFHSGVVNIPGTDWEATFLVVDASSQPKNILFGVRKFAETQTDKGWAAILGENCGPVQPYIKPEFTPTTFVKNITPQSTVTLRMPSATPGKTEFITMTVPPTKTPVPTVTEVPTRVLTQPPVETSIPPTDVPPPTNVPPTTVPPTTVPPTEVPTRVSTQPAPTRAS